MSYADKVFVANIKDILENGFSDENLQVRPRWEDGKHVEISNCSVNGVVSFTKTTSIESIGGLVGLVTIQANFVFKDITVDLEYNIVDDNAEITSVGGIVGLLNTPSSLDWSNVVNRSKNTLNVANSTNAVGGIFGLIRPNTKIKVSGCLTLMLLHAMLTTKLEKTAQEIANLLQTFAKVLE